MATGDPSCDRLVSPSETTPRVWNPFPKNPPGENMGRAAMREGGTLG